MSSLWFNFKILFKRKYYELCMPKFRFILSKKYFKNKYNILDIGCGGESPLQTKIIFPYSRYIGIDRDFKYHNSLKSIEIIDKKIKHDLNDSLDNLQKKIGDEKFDIVIFNHTIEHTFKGLDILNVIIPKIKSNGCIYIEFPSTKSLTLPSMKGTLNFCDDKTHLRVYSIRELANNLLTNKCSIIKAGKRFNIFSIILIPFRLVNCILFKKSPAGVFWDITGFADFVFAYKL